MGKKMSRVSRMAMVAAGSVIALAGVSCSRGGSDGRSAATGSWAQEQAAAPERQIRAVEAVAVSRGPLVRRIESSGTVRGASEAVVLSEGQGVIQSVSLELGSFVEEGTVLVQVESTIARLNVEEARQILESARLDLEATQRRFDNGSASQAELTRARSTANGARARLEVAEKALRDQTVRAPISGFVASRGENISRGNTIGRGTVVARIVDLTTLELEVGVGERELQFISVGAPAQVTIPGCGPQRYLAEVQAIAAGASQRTGSFPVVVAWQNQCSSVRSGMTASVQIAAQDPDPRVVIPGVSVRQDREGSFVFVSSNGAGEGTVTRRAVDLGARMGERVQVLGGLAEGDVVLTTGVSTLRDGDPVEVTVVGDTGDVL